MLPHAKALGFSLLLLTSSLARQTIAASPSSRAPAPAADAAKPGAEAGLPDQELVLEPLPPATPRGEATTPGATPRAAGNESQGQGGIDAVTRVHRQDSAQASAARDLLRPMLLVAGIACASTGAILLGTGVYTGAQALSERRGVSGATPSQTAAQSYEEAAAQARRANRASWAGGVAMGIGASLIALRLIDPSWLSSPAPRLGATVSGSRTELVLGW